MLSQNDSHNRAKPDAPKRSKIFGFEFYRLCLKSTAQTYLERVEATFHTECGPDQETAACHDKTELGAMLLEEWGEVGDGRQE